jgi:hypothetical protein
LNIITCFQYLASIGSSFLQHLASIWKQVPVSSCKSNPFDHSQPHSARTHVHLFALLLITGRAALNLNKVTAAALRTKDVADLTWEFVATTLIDESEARSMCTSAWKSKNSTDNDKSRSACAFFDKVVHSIDKCFYNPDNPNHQLPPKVLHRLLVSTDADGDRYSGATKSSTTRRVEIWRYC